MRYQFISGAGISCREDRFTSLKTAFVLSSFLTYRCDGEAERLLMVLNSIKRTHA